jgi:hypothetical protein
VYDHAALDVVQRAALCAAPASYDLQNDSEVNDKTTVHIVSGRSTKEAYDGLFVLQPAHGGVYARGRELKESSSVLGKKRAVKKQEKQRNPITRTQEKTSRETRRERGTTP